MTKRQGGHVALDGTRKGGCIESPEQLIRQFVEKSALSDTLLPPTTDSMFTSPRNSPVARCGWFAPCGSR
jgi:hypothetical protein